MKYVIGIGLIAVVGWFVYSQQLPSALTPEATTSTESATEPEAETALTDIVVDEVQVDDPDAALVADADAEAEATATTGVTREFTLDSFNFGYSQDTITVNEGDTVTINLTSSDGFHDWAIDEFAAATDQISPGETTSVTFIADQTGEFEYYCSVGSHRARGMVGTLIVE